jgi:GntR family transcriptional regulator
MSISDEMSKRGLVPASVVEQRVIEADEFLAAFLHVGQSSPSFFLRRLRLGNGEPLGIQSEHIPCGIALDTGRFDGSSP